MGCAEGVLLEAGTQIQFRSLCPKLLSMPEVPRMFLKTILQEWAHFSPDSKALNADVTQLQIGVT